MIHGYGIGFGRAAGRAGADPLAVHRAVVAALGMYLHRRAVVTLIDGAHAPCYHASRNAKRGSSEAVKRGRRRREGRRSGNTIARQSQGRGKGTGEPGN